tara:strand:+ start:777 stop:1361 length:585 start_codon:yes stop_codon:yes gene_type:complete
MANITIHPILKYKNKYQLNTLIETGTGGGGGIYAGIGSDFKYIYSCEINIDYYNKTLEIFKNDSDKNIKIRNEDSVTFLTNLFTKKEISLKDRILFWLDAHLPIDDTLSDNIILPLEQELKIISSMRPGKDVIIIDDMILYEPSLRHSAWKLRCFTKAKDNPITLKGILKYFPNHNHELDKRFEGSLILTPKGV